MIQNYFHLKILETKPTISLNERITTRIFRFNTPNLIDFNKTPRGIKFLLLLNNF